MFKKLGISAAVSFVSLPVIALAEASALESKELEVVEVSGKKETNGLDLDGTNSASNRLGLSALETPASIEVLSEESISIKGDHASLSAVTRAAGFASSASPGNGGSSVAVRGFNGHDSVVQTYDGTRLFVGAGTVTFPTDTWTIEKIEVLRGPGSVINGIGAIGATINYTSKSPKFTDIENELDVTVGSFGLRRLALGSGGEINQDLAYRVSAANHTTDGYADNTEETRNVFAGSMLYKLNDDLNIKFSVDYSDVDAPPYFGAPLVDGKVPERFRKSNYNVKDGVVEYEDLWPRVEVQWNISEAVTFRSNTYYLNAQRQWKNAERYTYDKNNDQIVRSTHYGILHDQTQLGTRNDLLLALDFGGMKNKINVGFELNDVEFTHTNSFNQGEQSETISPDSKDQNTWAEDGMGKPTKAYTTDTLQYAIFVDNHLAINDNYSVVAGLRHDTIDFKRKDFRSGDKLGFDISGTSWRLGLVYQPSENTSFYAQTSSAVDGTESPITMRKPERKLAKGKQLELGVKQSALDDKLQLTLAVFDIAKNNLVVKEPGGVERQIGQQSSRGVELNLFVQPLDSLDIEFNAAYVNAEYDEFYRKGESLKGKTPRNVPERTANLWANWRFIENWQLSGGARYVSERFSDFDNKKKMPEYTVFDASLNWIVNNDLQLALRGKNLTDEIDYVLSPYADQWILGDGRSVELGLNYSF